MADVESPKKGADTLLSPLTKPMESAPGWLTLSFASYAALEWLTDLSEQKVDILGRSAKFPVEIAAVLIAYFAYHLGDLVDKILYREWFEGFYDGVREDALKKLKIESGSYRIAWKLAASAKYWRHWLVRGCNEFAKFLRSLGVLSAVLSGCLAWYGERRYAAYCGLAAALSIVIYLILKPLHIYILYKNVLKISGNAKYIPRRFQEFVLFFWDGQFVDSAVFKHYSDDNSDPEKSRLRGEPSAASPKRKKKAR